MLIVDNKPIVKLMIILLIVDNISHQLIIIELMIILLIIVDTCFTSCLVKYTMGMYGNSIGKPRGLYSKDWEVQRSDY